MDIVYNKYLLAADVVLCTHFAFVAFVVIGFLFIWVGRYANLKLARNAKFRICHVLSMGIVLCESLFGMICPLTEWENDLRIKGGEGQIYKTSFMVEWVRKIMFFDFNERTFVVIYLLFFVLILLTFWIIPPEWKSKRDK